MQGVYRAANWVVMGETTGRGKNDQTGRPNRSIKQVLGLILKAFRIFSGMVVCPLLVTLE